ncbi:MAG: winged helix-turn-helix transcriptional regulator [Trueperaceae bacterium]|nr:winged helix-turn-helix transcriptional regulator [Trueperaceae bacterium]
MRAGTPMTGAQPPDPTAQLRTLSALAEPNRLRIVDLLRTGPLTVGEVAAKLQLRQPQASKHLKVLAEAGILEVRAEANRRIHALRPEPFESLDAWLERMETATVERFDRLDGYLSTFKEDPDV